MVSLKDKVTIVTGASSGIGAGIAKHFAALGSKLVLTGRNSDRLHEVASECKELAGTENVHAVVADLLKDDDIQAIYSETVSRFGRIDVLINNAGVVHIGSIENEDLKAFDELLATNLRAPYKLLKLAIPELKKTRGNVINISSAAGPTALGLHSSYCASKAGLDHLTRCAAIELGKDGIRVNSINPGAIKTDIFIKGGHTTEAGLEKMMSKLGQQHVLGRMGTVEEVAKMTAFIASDDASFTTGAIIMVDGGVSLMGIPSDIFSDII